MNYIRCIKTFRWVAPALRPSTLIAASVILATMAVAAAPARAATNVAVFNFQMKSDTPEWRWLEKGLADRITTDFAQDRDFAVVARDEMQVLADKMKWVPEMAIENADRVTEIRQRLRIEHLVTGVYGVVGDQITITGQVIEVEGRKEVARKQVAGKAEEILELQRRLSAELLTWFTKKKPEDILRQLPVWTRSLPAARALYEGMDLYDQGRYGEAWLKFRQASRLDAAYLEAQYWVGKMYYFMNRYEHARRALERFIYLDSAHPRRGDAMVEYLNTYELLNPPIATLLGLYEDFNRRFADAKIADSYGLIAATWLTRKQAQLLAEEGRYPDAVRLMNRDPHNTGDYWQLMTAYKFRAYLFGQEAYDPQSGVEGHGPAFFFTEAQHEFTWRNMKYEPHPGPGDLAHGKTNDRYVFIAPPGMAFKSLRFTPETPADNQGTIEIDMGREQFFVGAAYSPVLSDLPARLAPIAEAARSGVVVDNLTPSGVVIVEMDFRVRERVQQVRVAAELERLGPHGTIRVTCMTTPQFTVEVDGRFGRKGPGLVGMLAPGEHRVILRPADSNDPVDPWETKVVVREGQVTDVVGRLPWTRNGPCRDWPEPVLVGRDYGVHDSTEGGRNSRLTYPPAILADDQAIRLVWSYGMDLWSSVSTDGQTFTPPHRLDLPVSSGWREYAPQLERDESGRFILQFVSNRDAQHTDLLYQCWSRDFEHWSAPAVIKGRRTIALAHLEFVGNHLAVVRPARKPNDPFYIGMLAHHEGTIVEHPRWGCLAAWMQDGWAGPESGPFLVRGPSPAPLAARSLNLWDNTLAGAAGYAEQMLGKGDELLAKDKPDAAKDQYEEILKEFPDTLSATAARERLKRLTPPADVARKEFHRGLAPGVPVRQLNAKDMLSYDASFLDTLVGGIVVRRRLTGHEGEKTGPQPLETAVTGFYGTGANAGLYHFYVTTTAVEKLLSSRHPDCRPDPKGPDGPCGLDDPDRVPDGELEAAAWVVFMAYDARKQVTWQKGGERDWQAYIPDEDAPWNAHPGHKFAYGDNAAYPKKTTLYDDENLWKTYRRIQPVDADGKAAPDTVRIVEFLNYRGSNHTVIKVVQTMDMSASPGPKIKSYTITHAGVCGANWHEVLTRGPDACAKYTVEIEDVKDGDEAMRGQWIKAVHVPDEEAMKAQVLEAGRKSDLEMDALYESERLLYEAQRFEAAGSPDAARRLYRELIDKFPETMRAARARQLLEALNQREKNPPANPQR